MHKHSATQKIGLIGLFNVYLGGENAVSSGLDSETAVLEERMDQGASLGWIKPDVFFFTVGSLGGRICRMTAECLQTVFTSLLCPLNNRTFLNRAHTCIFTQNYRAVWCCCLRLCRPSWEQGWPHLFRLLARLSVMVWRSSFTFFPPIWVSCGSVAREGICLHCACWENTVPF